MSELPRNLPYNAPFGHQQKVALNALIPTLNAQQASWLSGYFAGIGQSAGQGASPVPAPPAAVAEARKVPLTILYGSESGNAESCADKAAQAAAQAGFTAKVSDMADYDKSKLATEKNVLVIVSTWGEGDPPAGVQIRNRGRDPAASSPGPTCRARRWRSGRRP